jgi:hypothetical protein
MPKTYDFHNNPLQNCAVFVAYDLACLWQMTEKSEVAEAWLPPVRDAEMVASKEAGPHDAGLFTPLGPVCNYLTNRGMSGRRSVQTSG